MGKFRIKRVHYSEVGNFNDFSDNSDSDSDTESDNDELIKHTVNDLSKSKIHTKTQESSDSEGDTQEGYSEKSKYKRIKAADIKLDKDETNHILVAARNQWGKTTLIKALLKTNKKKWNDVFCFTGSGSYCDDYKFLPKTNIFTPRKIIPVLKKLKQVLIEAKEAKQKYRILVIMDDILGVIDRKTMDFLDITIATCRHYGLTFIFSVQKIEKHISTTIRSNCGHLICGRVGMGSVKSTIFDLQEEIEDVYTFMTMYRRHMKHKYSFIWINNVLDHDNLVYIDP
jgi:hypothetical protein